MNKISPGQAIQAGWVRFKNQAALYVAFTVVYFVLLTLISSVGNGVGTMFGFLGGAKATLAISSIISGVAASFLTLGYAHVARKDQLGEAVEFGTFFDAFRVNQKPLLQVSLVTSLAGLISVIMFPDEFFNMASGQIQDPDEILMLIQDMSIDLRESSGTLIAVGLIQLVFSIGLMFSTYKASIDGSDLFESITWSFKVSIPNFLRIFITFFLVGILTAFFTVVTLFIGLLAIIPIIILVYYDMYDQVSDDQVLGIPLDEEDTV
jgi:uncharacterized membrane protein